MKQKTLHVIFKTHLDLGFTGMAQDVCSRYLEEFIPRALDLARATRDRGSQRFVWTTGSWIIDHFLRCAPPEQVRRMEAAIEDGDILWHALPFTTHTELMSPELFRHGLSISSELDRRFGKTTTAAKMSDVPGHTRSMIPCLREYGITYLHIGVNAGSSTVKAPPRFRWRHPGGEEILVSYGAGYDATTEDAGADDLLFFAHTGDNHGPP
ncbi:MAG: glycoside hydrolase, partial [Gemmatimonadetes bacterium]|nr:glycoside hydrolase [Gemmatimonadota bacterium]